MQDTPHKASPQPTDPGETEWSKGWSAIGSVAASNIRCTHKQRNPTISNEVVSCNVIQDGERSNLASRYTVGPSEHDYLKFESLKKIQ